MYAGVLGADRVPLLDKFRTRPAWQHRDAETRLAAVRQLGPDQEELLASIARSDEDARVRRAAARTSAGQSRSKSRGRARITVAKNGTKAGRPERW